MFKADIAPLMADKLSMLYRSQIYRFVLLGYPVFVTVRRLLMTLGAKLFRLVPILK